MRSRRAWFMAGLALFGSLVAAVYLLRVESVRVRGASALSAREIIETSGLAPGQRILWLRLTAAERRVERMPAIADVVATRSLPSTVVLTVTERRPLARLDRAPHLVVDAEGLVFPAGQAGVPVVLYGWKGAARSGAKLDARSRAVLGEIPQFPAPLREQSRKIEIGEHLVITLGGGTEIRFGRPVDLLAKAAAAAAVLRAAGEPVAYVDVRSPRVPVTRPRGALTPSPSPNPPS